MTEKSVAIVDGRILVNHVCRMLYAGAATPDIVASVSKIMADIQHVTADHDKSILFMNLDGASATGFPVLQFLNPSRRRDNAAHFEAEVVLIEADLQYSNDEHFFGVKRFNSSGFYPQFIPAAIGSLENVGKIVFLTNDWRWGYYVASNNEKYSEVRYLTMNFPNVATSKFFNRTMLLQDSMREWFSMKPSGVINEEDLAREFGIGAKLTDAINARFLFNHNYRLGANLYGEAELLRVKAYIEQ